MKKIFLLFIALLLISGFKAEDQPQNIDKKEQQAAEISNFVFLKIRDSFILQGITSNVRLYFNFNLNMPLDVTNQEVSSMRKEIVNELGDEYLKKLNANGFLNSQILLFKESLKKKFNEEEINEISIYIPSKSISLNVDEGKFAFLRDNKKFTKFLDKYRFSELYYQEVSKLITPSFSIELFDSLKSILEKHGYKEGYEFNTNPLVLSWDILGQWSVAYDEPYEWKNVDIREYETGAYMVVSDGSSFIQFDNKFNSCYYLFEDIKASCNVELVSDSMIDIEIPGGVLAFRRNKYNSWQMCMHKQEKNCIGVTNWRTKGERYLGDYKKVSKSKGRVQFGKSFYLYEGFGTAHYWAGGKYVGNWKTHRHHGKGMFFYGDGAKYEGEFDSGYRHGKGTYTFKNGNYFEGQFVNGERQGLGKLTTKSGKTYEGMWKNDKRTGSIKITDEQGNISECIYVKGNQRKCS